MFRDLIIPYSMLAGVVIGAIIGLIYPTINVNFSISLTMGLTTLIGIIAYHFLDKNAEAKQDCS